MVEVVEYGDAGTRSGFGARGTLADEAVPSCKLFWAVK